MNVKIRPAKPEEARVLTALCTRSKAHWGYDSEFMHLSAEALKITPGMIDAGNVLVAEDHASKIVGVAAVEALQGEGQFDLSRLFLEPSVFGTGVGRALFESAVELVRTEGGKRLSILSDPFAEGFYQRLGAVKIGEAPSDAIPGRLLPLLDYAIGDFQ